MVPVQAHSTFDRWRPLPFAFVIVSVFSSFVAPAAEQPKTGPFVVGIVEIPVVFGAPVVDTPTPRTPPPAHVSLYRDAAGSIPFANVSAPGDLEALEYGYEASGAVVYERTPHAYRVRLSDGRYGWLRMSDAGTFHSLMSLYAESLSYLTGHWDGRLFESPAGSASLSSRPARLKKKDDETPIRVAEGKEDHSGRVWIRIEVLSAVCSANEPRVLDRGWVPAHNSKGQLNVWFWSRGC